MCVVRKLVRECGGGGLRIGAGIGVGGCCGGAGVGGGGVGVLGLRAARWGFGVLRRFALEVAAQEADCAIGDDADGFA